MEKSKQILYFLGIGGIGMSALARYFNAQGSEIYGYDLHATPLTRALEREGMKIHYSPDITLIPQTISKVIYTPAVPKDNLEFQYFLTQKIPMLKRAETIGEISHQLITLAVAGTHGKTSITAMLAHILHRAQYEFVAFIGGISKNLKSNFYQSAHPRYMVIEADEYDRSLLQLAPNRAIITSMEADHLDIYADLDDLQQTFRQFAAKLGADDLLVYHSRLKGFEYLDVPAITYGLGPEDSVQAKNIHIESGRYCFELWQNGDFLGTVRMQVPGKHYVENALAAAAVARSIDIPVNVIIDALEHFSGVERRFDVKINQSDVVYIDDYAHHPTEIDNTLQAARSLYATKKICAVFQPHLFSRTRDFADDFARVLSKADCVVLLDIYPAREKPIEGVNSRLIFDKLTSREKYLLSKTELLQFLQNETHEVVLTLGAGDIGLMVNEIEKILRKG
jgi:UDP-N-acetylmuramate--alanine ligase